MINTMVIGIGGGGNSAAIELVERNVIDKNNLILINKTSMDIPKNYLDSAIIINSRNDGEGAGKERELGREECLKALQNGSLPIEKLINPGTELVIIVSSTEGGTGSGAAPTLANYIKNVLDIDVNLHGFTGFENDVRGLRNTVGFFKDVDPNISLTITRNMKYLKPGSTDFVTAEKEADMDFCIKMSILMGNIIKDSSHNIDPGDLKKVSAFTPGYKVIEYAETEGKIKSTDQYDDFIRNMITSAKSMDTASKTQKALAVIVNLPESEIRFIDGDQKVLKETYGDAFECFTHIQSYEDLPYSVSFISSGMDVPIEEVDEIYSKYVDSVGKVKKTKDSFFDAIHNFEYEDDSQFDSLSKRSRRTVDPSAKSDFFSKFSMETPNRKSTMKAAEPDMKKY